VCVLDARGGQRLNRDLPNDAGRIVAAVARHGRPRGCAIEACGGSADLAQELVDRFGWSVDMAHPGFVKRMKQNPDKSDYTDARMLADLERVGYLPKVWLAPRTVRDLRTLVRDRQWLARQRRSLKLQIGALLREHRVRRDRPGKNWTRTHRAWLATVELPEHAQWVLDQRLDRLTWIESQITAVEQRLHDATVDDPVVQKLLSIRGVGPVVAWTLRAEVRDFGRFRSGKQLARFCGLTPSNRSSGLKQADAGLVKQANGELRRVLIESAWALSRNHPKFSELARSLRGRGKPGSLVSAAVANRFVRWLHHEMQRPLTKAEAA
jgi:transposase